MLWSYYTVLWYVVIIWCYATLSSNGASKWDYVHRGTTSLKISWIFLEYSEFGIHHDKLGPQASNGQLNSLQEQEHRFCKCLLSKDQPVWKDHFFIHGEFLSSLKFMQTKSIWKDHLPWKPFFMTLWVVIPGRFHCTTNNSSHGQLKFSLVSCFLVLYWLSFW